MSLAEPPSLNRDEPFSKSSDVAVARNLDTTTTTSRAAQDVVGLDAVDMDGTGTGSNSLKSAKDAKGKKRTLFGFGKKKGDGIPTSSVDAGGADATPPAAPQPYKASTTTNSRASTKSPMRARAHMGEHAALAHHSSPTRAFSSSPRLSSPAGSQIFERDVQDSTVLKPSSPAIPTHIQTENYIPPVLDDASEAITNDSLDPDAVEIVTHASHQPASVTVTGAPGGSGVLTLSSSPLGDQLASEWAAELASFADRVGLPPETASNYGSLDSTDVRRLSFISFADVVQAEHSTQLGTTMGSGESIHMAGMTSLPPPALNRSPSPIRSPVSSAQAQGTSLATSNPGSLRGSETSPSRKPLGSPQQSQALAAPGGDLSVETMRQALRRTGSTDLSSFKSNPTSHPTSPIEGPASR